MKENEDSCYHFIAGSKEAEKLKSCQKFVAQLSAEAKSWSHSPVL